MSAPAEPSLIQQLVNLLAQLVATIFNAIGLVQLLFVAGMVAMVMLSFYAKPIKTWRQFFNWVLVLGVIVMLCVIAYYFFGSSSGEELP